MIVRNLWEEGLAHLHRAVHAHGDNVLLYVHHQDELHPNGTVERANDGLLIGYIDRFAFFPENVSLPSAMAPAMPLPAHAQ